MKDVSSCTVNGYTFEDYTYHGKKTIRFTKIPRDSYSTPILSIPVSSNNDEVTNHLKQFFDGKSPTIWEVGQELVSFMNRPKDVIVYGYKIESCFADINNIKCNRVSQPSGAYQWIPRVPKDSTYSDPLLTHIAKNSNEKTTHQELVDMVTKWFEGPIEVNGYTVKKNPVPNDTVLVGGYRIGGCAGAPGMMGWLQEKFPQEATVQEVAAAIPLYKEPLKWKDEQVSTYISPGVRVGAWRIFYLYNSFLLVKEDQKYTGFFDTLNDAKKYADEHRGN